MITLAWLTDIHINFLEKEARAEFYQEIINTECDALLVTGDIAEAPNVVALLTEMADFIKKPIYFVAGNHDYYRGQVSEVRQALSALTQSHHHLYWLPASGPHRLDNNTILLGQDGWADGRFGDFINSKVVLNDSRLIADLFQASLLGRDKLLNAMQQLADADAKQLHDNLIHAITQSPKKIIVLTHIPAFKESCVHLGKISDDDWQPYMSSKVLGDVLLQVAQDNPLIDFMVLCGHTHSESYFQPLTNLAVYAGHAEYYRPTVQNLIAL